MRSKHLFVFGCLLCIGITAYTQNPVKWEFTSKKIAESKIAVYITATIQRGWHVYASKQPPNAIAVPTRVVFNPNPLLRLNGRIKEEGKLLKVQEKELDIEAWQYADKLIYVQTVELSNSKVKTNLAGTLEFQACMDHKCLPPVTISFSIPLDLSQNAL